MGFKIREIEIKNKLVLAPMAGICNEAFRTICKEMGVETPTDYKFLFQSMVKDADKVQFRLDSNKSILCSVEKTGVSAAKFRAIPVLSAMKEPLIQNGYFLTELESGLEFSTKDTAVGAIISACQNFKPVVEDVSNTVNTVTKLVGSSCKEALMSYGIDDRKGVFSSFYRVVFN